MKMIEITKDRFENFAKNNEYNNYCQTENYGMLMSKTGYKYNFVAYTTNDLEILAAGMFLTKKIGKYYYAYCPKGFIIDYQDEDLVRRFTNNLKKYYKRKNIILLKINPEIDIATIDYKNNYERIINSNINILNNLKKLGFKKRKELEPLQLLQPKLNAIIDLKNYDANKLDKNIKNKINSSNTKGLELIKTDETKIDILYEFIKMYNDRDIDYYKELYNVFSKDNNIDFILVKVDYKTYLINAKKKVEEEQEKNDKLNERLKKNTNDKNLNEKMESDKILEEYKQDVIYATQGLKKQEETYIAGAIVIKHNQKISILISGTDENYNYMYPNYFLHNQILEIYKKTYEIADINCIADDFSEKSKFSKLNRFKFSFNPTIKEYIGELDLVINNWKFKIIEKNSLLSNEFTKKKDTTK